MSRPPVFTYTITTTKVIPGLTLETIVREIKQAYPKLPPDTNLLSLSEVIIAKHQPDIPKLQLIIMANAILKFYRVKEILASKKPKD